MDFKINGVDKKLIFGVRFVADLDESEKISEQGIEFGMGLLMAQEKLKMGNYPALIKVLKFALAKENVTEDEVADAIDEYSVDNDLEVLFSKIEEELKNSNAVRTALARMEKVTKEANRKKSIKAVK